MDRHKKQIIDVWERLSAGEKNYLLRLAKIYVGHHVTIGLLPLVGIDRLLPHINRGLSYLAPSGLQRSKDDRVRFMKRLKSKLT